jgi:hypothetical protein
MWDLIYFALLLCECYLGFLVVGVSNGCDWVADVCQKCLKVLYYYIQYLLFYPTQLIVTPTFQYLNLIFIFCWYQLYLHFYGSYLLSYLHTLLLACLGILIILRSIELGFIVILLNPLSQFVFSLVSM